ncbi:MAG: hypothetical protein IJS54_02635 [Desulfovibrio sp.]|nr:hypothetical protein [Desulfovibrio sp.]
MATLINLESICADYGFQMAEADSLDPKDKENVITKALGVLAENGFYALSVFLLSINQKTQAKYGEKVEEILIDMLTSPSLALLTTKHRDIKALPDLRTITEDLPRLILARRVTEQALTFARYHCKALGRR